MTAGFGQQDPLQMSQFGGERVTLECRRAGVASRGDLAAVREASNHDDPRRLRNAATVDHLAGESGGGFVVALIVRALVAVQDITRLLKGGGPIVDRDLVGSRR